jgi:hypothetical protein
MSYLSLRDSYQEEYTDLTALDPCDHEDLADKFGIAHQLIQEIEFMNDENGHSDEDRWSDMLVWAKGRIKQPEACEVEK